MEAWVPKTVNTGTSVVSGKLAADTGNTTDRDLPNETISMAEERIPGPASD